MWIRTGLSIIAKNNPTYYSYARKVGGQGGTIHSQKRVWQSAGQGVGKGREQTVATQLMAQFLAETTMVVQTASHSCHARKEDDCIQILES
ncbi:expressed protein [Echinococcus multilocularis]|uniref:Expressed protein n=1 Tax=Echinococcus multilocularis TaxID=6211 RepID=A0A087VYY0_ECHMU|nr:expressed protein [Echinococcus multilocularis]